MVNQNTDVDKYKRNLGKVVIYFQSFNYETIVESAAYDVSFIVLLNCGKKNILTLRHI